MRSLNSTFPHLIVMAGIPGSGKTSFAEQFAETFSAPFISYPQLLSISHDTSSASDIAIDLLIEVMKTRQAIIFEGETATAVKRAELTKFAQKHKYQVLFIWVQTDYSTAKARLAKQLSSSDYDQLAEQFEPLEERENHVVISGRHTYSTQVRAVLKRLSPQQKNPSDRSTARVITRSRMG